MPAPQREVIDAYSAATHTNRRTRRWIVSRRPLSGMSDSRRW